MSGENTATEFLDELEHYGIMGMHWGIRRYQDKSGALTNAGKKRYSDGSSKEDRAKVNRRKAALKKARKTRAKNIAKKKEAAETKEKSKNDPAKILKNYDLYDDKEMDAALSRLEKRSKLKDYRARDVERGKKYVENLVNITGNAIKAYNQFAGVYNAYLDYSGSENKRLVQVNVNPDKKKKKSWDD